MKSHPDSPRAAFSLIEVVIATAIFAASIVAIIGLMSPLSRRVEDVIDSETAIRLAASIQEELERIGWQTATQPWFLAMLDPEVDPEDRIQLVSNSRGDRVRLKSGADPAADNPLDDATLPGIAERDRYFLVTLSIQFPFSATDSGSLALRADVTWPYQLPEAPATATVTATGAGADPATPVPGVSRETLAYFFALTP